MAHIKIIQDLICMLTLLLTQNAPLGPYNLQVQDAISYNWFTLNNAFNIVPLDTTPSLTSSP